MSLDRKFGSIVRENYLHGSKTEESNPNGAMSSILNTLGFTSELKSGSPTSYPNSIGRSLAERMKIKPSRICRLESSHVPSNNGSNWKHDSPTHNIQNPMNLAPKQSNSITRQQNPEEVKMITTSPLTQQLIISLLINLS